MSTINNKTTKKITKNNRVSGGYGKVAAKEDNFHKLKRLIQLAVIGEERYYSEGKDITDDIIYLSEKVAKEKPDSLMELLNFTRLEIGLRHSPLFTLLGILKTNPQLLKKLDDKFFLRPSDLMDIIALYYQYNTNTKTLPKQLKKAIEQALNQYDLYQFSKYGRHKKNLQINLVDVFNLVHPKPITKKQKKLFRKVIQQDLPVPETWEHLLSNSQLTKKEAWEHLLKTKKLPSLAFIRNIRNMLKAEVDKSYIKGYIDFININRIFPAQILSAVVSIDDLEIRKSLLNKLKKFSNPILKGKSLIVLDISGSMGTFSLNKDFLKSYAFRAVSVMLSIILNSEEIDIVLTSGDDYGKKHKSIFLKNKEKEMLLNGEIESFLKLVDFYQEGELGWGGIFTKQALSWIKKQNKGIFDRAVVISDSQDMDYNEKSNTLPKIAKYQYINNIAAYKNVGYYNTVNDEKDGIWEEITTYSSKLIDFIILNEKKF